MLSALLALSFTQCATLENSVSDFRLIEGSQWIACVSREWLNRADVASVAQPTDSAVRQKRKVDSLHVDAELSVWVARFRGVNRDDQFNVLFLGEQEPKLDKESRYLVVAVGRDGERLNVNSGSAEYWKTLTLKAQQGDDAWAAIVVETALEALPAHSDRATAVTLALLKSLDLSDHHGANQLAMLLGSAHPEWLFRPNALAVSQRPEDSPFRTLKEVPYCPAGVEVRALDDAIASTTDLYVKSKLVEVRLRWRVPGSLKLYVEALKPLLHDSRAYVGQTSNSNIGLVMELNRQFADLDGYYSNDAEEFVREVTAAKNPEILLLWLRNLAHIMDEGQLRRFARLLDFGDKRVQFEVITILASLMREPDQGAQLYGTVDGKSVDYPDLDEKVAYWKKRMR